MSDNTTQPANTFSRFASVAQAVGATTKRLEKAAILGDYFASLGDTDLVLAARYFAGTLFSLSDQRTINIGGAALLWAIQSVSGQDENDLRALFVSHGDAGDAAYEALQMNSHNPPQSLSLQNVSAALETLATTAGSHQKRALVAELLQRATPLEAKYVVKLLSGDLRIGLKEGAVEDAIARLIHAAAKLDKTEKIDVARVQWANMLLGDIGETALLARHNRLHEARMKLLHPLKFMLASPAADLSEVARTMPQHFFVEDKYDGIRAQVHIVPHRENNMILHGATIGNRRVAFFSRTLDDITPAFPDLLSPLAALLPDDENAPESGLILDGEIVPIEAATQSTLSAASEPEGKRILPFQELQKRLGRKIVSDETLAQLPVAFVAYDILYGARHILIDEPFESRRRVLEELSFDASRARLAPSQIFSEVARLDEEFDASRARGNEGLMVKAPQSTYKPGRRGRDWLKIKRALATLDVVVTAVETGNGRRHKVLSDYTFAVRASETDATLLNIGKAYSGLTDIEIAELSEWFRAHTLQTFAHGKVRVVEPKIVIEVTFDRVQASPRHKSGFALRFPRIVRVRDDKPVEEIDTLETVRKLRE